MSKKFVPFFIIFFLSGFFSFAQNVSQSLPGNAQQAAISSANLKRIRTGDWIGMMQDGHANFYDIQKAFNKYWKKKEKETLREKKKSNRSKASSAIKLSDFETSKAHKKKGGFKQFKRWENFWKPRVYPTGEFPNPSIANEEALQWKNSHPQTTFQNPKNQTVNTQTISNWTLLGPGTVPTNGGGAGRINCIRFDPTNSNIIYAGASAGGLWKSINGGTGWTTLTDNLQVLGVSDVLINPANTSTMYLATGDGDYGDTYSLGVLKSTDGGVTWNATGLNWAVSQTRKISKLLMHPSNPSIILAATNLGVYKTIDGGNNWTLTLTGGVIYDIEFKTGDPTVVYASGIKFYKSTNTGDTFSQITSGLPASGTSRIAIGVTANDVNYVYLLAANNTNFGLQGVYLSTDAGTTFITKFTPSNPPTSSSPNILGWTYNGTDAGGQGWYDLSINVDPTNKAIVYVGGVNQWRSSNSGAGWTCISTWDGSGGKPYVHADVHAMEFLPGNAKTLYSGNDGGLFKGVTSNGSSWTWTDLSNGLAITQMYRLSTSTTNINLNLTGNQDNGTTRCSSGSWSRPLSGDGMECIIDYNNANIMYGEIYYGAIYKSTNGGVSFPTIIANSGGTGVNENGDWVTPYVMHPTSSTTLLIGKSQVYQTTDGGTNWIQLGTITGGNGSLIALAYAPSDPNTIYAAKTNKLLISNNSGTNWNDITAGLPTANASITYITVDPKNAQRLWVTFSGYSSGNKVFFSHNGGMNWINVSGTLPNIPVNCIVYQKNTNDALYIGTDVGVYYKDYFSADWSSFMTGLPNVIVDELEIQYDAGKLRAATFGRGLWESPYNVPPSNIIITGAISPSVYCAGSTINMPYSATGTYNSSNIFTAQLSDANGSFTNPTDIGSVASITSGVIVAAIPNATLTGTGYKIRVIASDPSITGQDNESNIRINAQPAVSITTPSPSCTGGTPFQITAAANVGGSQYQLATGTNTSSSGIFDGTNGGMKTQFIYTKADLNAAGISSAGIIKSLGFQVNAKATAGNFIFQNFTIKLQNTSLSVLTNSFITSGFSQVFSSNTSTISGWNDFYFTTPFDWDGTSNLLIDVCFSNTSAGGGQDFVYSTTTSNTRTNIQGLNACNASTGTLGSNRPNVRITYGTLTCSWNPAAYLSGSNVLQPTFNPSTTGNFLYSLTVIDDNACSNTSTTAITVNPSLQPSVSIAATAATICAGTSVTFTATPLNGGSSPSYQWQINGNNVGTNSDSYTSSVFNDSDVVSCIMMSNISSCISGNPATSNSITMTIHAVQPVNVSVIIATSTNTICAGTSVIFTAIPTNGGSIPSYQWQINGSNVGTGGDTYSSSSLSNNDEVTCILTPSPNPCSPNNPVTSNSITMTVNAMQPVSVNIAATANSICTGSSITFTAVPVNGGSNPTYQWKINGNNVGYNDPVYLCNYVADNDIVSCMVTSTANCVTGNPAVSNSLVMTTYSCDSVALHLTALLEGFYIGNHKMRNTLYHLNLCLDSSFTDTIEVNLWSPLRLNDYSDYSAKAIIHSDGKATFNFPLTAQGSSYYIAFKHRNTLETWSSVPITFSLNTSYDFTTSPSQAYGNNMMEAESGIWVIYNGDVTEDGITDVSDFNVVASDIQLISQGYVKTDLSGDGIVDVTDFNLLAGNVRAIIKVQRPY